ncbi:hypothetical protein F5Y02DRAFT_410420 [Annulohypoxylon stygium]|nr:hypothetical protein F5Y02DRAFT_410420 [Annulohypoxylon stygium]
MAAAYEEVENALSLVEETKLPHPSSSLLDLFVTQALYPVLAARYAKNRLLAGEALSLVDDWSYIIESMTESNYLPPQPSVADQHSITKRDNGKCCITGKAGTWRDPLIVAPILPIPCGWNTNKANISDMLGAFFGPPYRDWWLSYIKHPELTTSYRNHWLVRKSAARAFALGLIKLDRCQPSMIHYEVRQFPIGPEGEIEIDGEYPLLGDHSRSGITTVDARFVGTQARLSRSIQFLNLSKMWALETPYRIGSPAQRLNMAKQNCLSPTTLFISFFSFIMHFLPAKLKICLYRMLVKLGGRLYGSNSESCVVQRLPFGLYFKSFCEGDRACNELNALQMVRQHTSIPVPQVVDIVRIPRDTYLFTTRMPGVPLWRCQEILTERDIERISNQLKSYLVQLRDIPHIPQSTMGITICNSLGLALNDSRIRGGQKMGPFADEASFSRLLRYPDDPVRRGHKITIQSDGSIGWSVTGIVDWEFAGFYPEYWDCTKSMFEGFRWPKRYNNMIRGVFSELADYSRELDIEKRSWESGDAV